ncbi:pyrroline-5-carboxylate reductase [Enterococcus faecalis]|uniref:pyrroline-5-carboxylate reductase n=1 Tax=Enterococcus faecalis TaxID=1351 RepID=UPI000DEBD572|nr:pyrroline-5-carboxylate reductase [Enterococcus faecalis]EGO8274852.1 pyrroline-5-carboxylate reductase [Enterococcus faecalis]EGO9001720.1 pyrroline-5-carboxylate reductase [Enterococcus faecalis]MDB1624408.1 pyrroline-5-carboxylate reductase [Enterococcus faecalis]NSW09868.1 pyrroline-5-carboxylate reductase [Enterococcus faecalis]RBR45466.1 pyrroline-5-carboxylate reductase [Enterococcus faecalis]
MKISFIGAGNMASAIAKGALKKQFIAAENLYFYDIQVEKTAAFAQEIGAHAVASPQEAIAVADLVILAVKPQFVQAALLEAKEAILDKQPLIVSIAAGTTIAELYQLFETTQSLRLVRVMPNMNALIGAGAAAVCGNTFTSTEDIQTILSLFRSVGQAWELEEQYFSIFTAIAGSTPAYSFLFIDSIARAAVKNGMNKELALEIATQAVLGSAQTLANSTENPWTLIDQVSSPGGTTVAGIVELENNAFISTVIKGIEATILRDQELAKQN